MKTAVHIVRVITGLLFIVSGLVKANDPLGLAYKMQEFFEIWNGDLASSGFFLKQALIATFRFFHAHALALSVMMIVLEVMTGIALIIGWQRKVVLPVLLLLMLFFTFLTAYAYASGKFKNCGCFGDCLPISPLASLVKDLVLLAAVAFLIAGRRHIRPVLPTRFQAALLAVLLLGTIGFQWYVLQYMPVVDCLPFKKGASITEGMKIPAHAVPDSFAIRFVYKKEGRQYEFSPAELPADLGTYEFVSRQDKLIRKGNAEPPIKGFSLTGVTNTDSTQVVLAQPYALLFFYDNTEGMPNSVKNAFSRLYNEARLQRSVPVYFVTTYIDQAAESLKKQLIDNTAIFKIDHTAFRTAARTNPSIYLLKGGTIVNKWSGRQTDAAIAAVQKIKNL